MKCNNFRQENRPWLKGGDAVSYYHVPIAIDVLIKKPEPKGETRNPAFIYAKADWIKFRAVLDQKVE